MPTYRFPINGIRHHDFKGRMSTVTKCKLTVGPKDDSFTLEFKSVIAFGVAEEVTDDTENNENASMLMLIQLSLAEIMTDYLG